MNTEFDRITIDTELMNGQPCIRGRRLTVRRVICLLLDQRLPRSTVCHR